MEITRVGFNSFGINNRHRETNKKNNFSSLRISNSISNDNISFSSRLPKLPARERMVNYAQKLLTEMGLKEEQPLRVSAESKYLPFLRVLTEESYKKNSGVVSLDIINPELKALREKYKITELFDYQKEFLREAKEEGALEITFNESNCPYKAAGLSKKEISQQIASITTKIPKKIKNLFNLNPKEIFKTALDIHEGEPVIIKGEREHLPQIVKLVEWLYSKNKTRLVNVSLTESKEFNPTVAFYKYANKKLIGKFSKSIITEQKERCEKDVALLALKGSDPQIYSEIDSKIIIENTKPLNNAARAYYNQAISNSPWLVYLAPTTKSTPLVYPEFGENKIAALEQAYKDAKLINRVGKLKPHIKSIELRAQKMNELLDKGYSTIHYLSVDPVTKLPNGKTDLKIGLSPKSFFNSARMKMERTKHNPIANIPTEEIFTSPQANTAEGHVTATMPLVLNGKVVNGIEMTFKKGKVIKIKASENEEMLKEHIKAYKNADRLGEVALVADSPIFKMNRLHYTTLVDENATCHVAIGNAYTDAVKGADDIEDYAKQQEYLKKLKINQSSTHNDFMIGGPDVYVFAENPKTGEQIQIIKDDKFIL